LQTSGKQLKPKKQKSVPTNIDCSTLQRGHQYFMEGYIPGKHAMFYLKDGVIWMKACCCCIARRSMRQCMRLKLPVQMSTHTTWSEQLVRVWLEKLECAVMSLVGSAEANNSLCHYET